MGHDNNLNLGCRAGRTAGSGGRFDAAGPTCRLPDGVTALLGRQVFVPPRPTSRVRQRGAPFMAAEMSHRTKTDELNKPTLDELPGARPTHRAAKHHPLN